MDGARTERRASERQRSTLRVVLFNLVFLLAPIGVYFLYYVEARSDQTIVRNFRALDASATRLQALIANIPLIAGNVPVGVPLSADFGSADLLRAKSGCEAGTMGELRGLARLRSSYLQDFRSAPSSTAFDVTALPRQQADARGLLRTFVADCVADDDADRFMREFLDSLSGRECAATEGVSRAFVQGTRGVELEVRDCREFDRRSPEVSRAVRSTRLSELLASFGIRIRVPFESLLESVSANAAPLFDQLLIADEAGRVLYAARETRTLGPAQSGARRVPLDIVNQVDLRALVDPTARSAAGASGADLEELGLGALLREQGEWRRYGVHSRLEPVRVAEHRFNAYVHPLVVDGVRAPGSRGALPPPAPGNDGALTAARASDESPRTTLFLVGFLSDESANAASLALRLSFVVDALLLTGVLLAAFSFLWLWTAGDRLMLGTRHFLLFGITGLVCALLFTLFAAHRFTASVDATAFDGALSEVSARLRADFDGDLRDRQRQMAKALDRMLEIGEASARRRLTEEGAPGAADDDEESARLLAERFACGVPASEVERWSAETARRAVPPFDLAFLLDGTGRQWQCLSFRLFDTAPLNLAFRRYFEAPRSGELWRVGGAERDMNGARKDTDDAPPAVPLFADRITSVLDGTTETVTSTRPERLCLLSQAPDACSAFFAARARAEPRQQLPAIVAVGRFRSLEHAVLPPHLRFAVVENATGRTLFHSVAARSLSENLLRQADGDAALAARLASGQRGFVDLDYHGGTVRAHVGPLAQGIPWSLVVYRGRELEDTVGLATVSLTAFMVLLGWIAVVAGLVARWLLVGRDSVIVLWPWRSRGARQLHVAQAQLAVLFGAVTLLVVAGAAVQPWFAFVAALLALAGTPVVLWQASRAAAGRREADGDLASVVESGEERTRLAGTVACMFVLLAVLPAAGLYVYHRAALSGALVDYLADTTVTGTAAACTQFRERSKRYRAPYGSAAHRLPVEGIESWSGVLPGRLVARPSGFEFMAAGGARQAHAGVLPCEGFDEAEDLVRAVRAELEPVAATDVGLLSEIYDGLSGAGPLAGDLLSRSAAHGLHPELRSPAAAMERLLGAEVLAKQDFTWFLPHLLLVVALSIGGGALMFVIVVSIVDRVMGVRLRLAVIPRANVDALPGSWCGSRDEPLRACAIHSSQSACRETLAALRAARFERVLRGTLEGDRIVWRPFDPGDAEEPFDEVGAAGDTASADTDGATDGNAAGEVTFGGTTLHVVFGLERLLLRVEARDVLLAELERLGRTEASLLLFSRMLPGFWLSRMSEEVSGDVANASERAAITARWSHVLAPFDVRRIRVRPTVLDARFDAALRDYHVSATENEEHAEVCALMRREAMANPELLDFAAAVTRQVLAPDFTAPGSRRHAALQRFAAGSAGHFHETWAASTREERLQLLALAERGFANPMETAVLSSLANRDLISTDGIVALRSEAFASFVLNDLVHDRLLAWRDAGHGNLWRSIWPPLVTFVVLAFAFFLNSTPEAIAPLAALLAAGFGAVPVIGSLLRGVRDLRGGAD